MLYEPQPIGRVCRQCGAWKPYAQLKKNRNSPDNCDALCLECHKRRESVRFANNRETILEKERQKRRANPEAARARDRARNNDPERRRYRQEYGRKYYKANKAKSNERSKQYAKAHPEVFRESGKRWAAKNHDKVRQIKRDAQQRRKARKQKLPATFTDSDWGKALAYFGNTCAYCGRPQGFWHTLAQDHFVPISRGGGYVPQNIVPACHGDGGCNNLKNDRDPAEWLTARFGKRKARQILARIEAYFASLNP